MEKQILDILNEKTILHHLNSIGYNEAAKAIASLFGEFNDWCIVNTYKSWAGYYGDYDLNEQFETQDELFLYWFENIKTK